MRPDDFEGVDRSVLPLLPAAEEAVYRLGGNLAGFLLLLFIPPGWWDGRGFCAIGHTVGAAEVEVDVPIGELTRFQLATVEKELRLRRCQVGEDPNAVGQRLASLAEDKPDDQRRSDE